MWLQDTQSISVLSNRALTPIACADSPQISVLRKDALEQLGAQVIALMMELTIYVPCAWDGKTVAPLAKSLIDTYWGLRFDELIYFFRKIKNGEYGKEFGQLHYNELSRRLSEYCGNERSELESHLRQGSIEEFKETQSAIIDLVPKEKFSELAKAFTEKARVERNESATEITHESIDRKTQKFIYELNYYGNLPDADLFNFYKDAQEYGWKETLLFCKEEIEKRKLQ